MCYSGYCGYFGRCNICAEKETKEKERIEENVLRVTRGEDILEKTDHDPIQRSIYHGETGRTAFTRITEHINDYKTASRKKIPEDHFMIQHVMMTHPGLLEARKLKGEEECPRSDFSFGVTGTFQKATYRILDESSRVRLEEDGLINTGGGSKNIVIMHKKKKKKSPAKGREGDIHPTMTNSTLKDRN
jgi:hypothetical protein